MARRKGSGKKKKKSRKPEGPSRGNLWRAFLSVLLLVCLALAAGYWMHAWKPRPSKRVAPPPAAVERKAPVHRVPAREAPAPPREAPPQERPAAHEEPREPETPAKPLAAIIIDDLGYDLPMAEAILDLPARVAVAILPHTPFAKQVAQKASGKGAEVLVHLPMEPDHYPGTNPGPGTLLTTMSGDELLETLQQDLDAVPFAVGVNNHEGSRMTAQSETLYPIFTVLKKKGLFFVDSRTTNLSECRPAARLLHVPFASRDVFLDHEKDPDFIRGQMRELARIALKKGFAVAIAHPRPLTLEILKESLPRLQEQVEIVPVSRLVRVPD